ncbi:alkylation response protein AidB-like acyl-CoA dehydrogenase [Sphingobium sp. OAS761]|uniref:acyl-CoA dehydrogenase n=1 Tax=Sphingobium sp. OAS761 TaxID=2817901 RepID=UPI00209E42D6|nr:acyl-CoA dehydrogenase [Sphingobium sp. OAS761]MCP1472406.1 alkylation response protein AidB-like acyl-CoA dehydrogenase [Sphingobium sp. OAS761]
MNLELAQEQLMLRDSLERLLQRDSTSARIRAAEPLGFDKALWGELVALGLPLLRVPETAGGAGLSLLDAVLVAEMAGKYLASAPLIEGIVANQMLARIGGKMAEPYLAATADGDKIVTLALHPVQPGVAQLVPAGAVADWILCSDGEAVYLVQATTKPGVLPNTGTMPLASLQLDLSGATVLGKGTEALTVWAAGLDEWKLLVASCVSAIGSKALVEAAAYANERKAFGQLIGSYQGLAHPLADSATDIEGSGLLCWRAATEPDHALRSTYISAAAWWSAYSVPTATIRAMRTLGGYGMSMEYDAQLYFRRGRAWALLIGDPAAELAILGERLWADRRDPAPDRGANDITFEFGEAADAFAAEARAFFADRMTPEMRVFAHETDDGNHPFNAELAAAGYLYADWPEACGGGGRSAYEMGALNGVYTEFSWPKIPSSVSHMVGKILMHFAGEDVKQEVLPRLASGKSYAALGYSEPSCGSDIFAAATRAVREGDDWIVNGQKMFTSQGHLADYVLLITRTDPDLPKHAGLTLFLVPTSIAGYEVHEIKTLGGERTNVTYYENMRVPDRYRIGEVNGGTKVLGTALKLEQGGGEFFVSALRIMLRHAEQWGRTPQQDGMKPLDSAAIRARVAASHVRMLVADVLDKRCQWAFVNNVPGKHFGPMSKLFASEALVSCSTDLMDLAAPWSLLQGHHDLGVVELESRKAIQATIYGGTSEVQRSIIAESALNLPRTRN